MDALVDFVSRSGQGSPIIVNGGLGRYRFKNSREQLILEWWEDSEIFRTYFIPRLSAFQSLSGWFGESSTLEIDDREPRPYTVNSLAYSHEIFNVSRIGNIVWGNGRHSVKEFSRADWVKSQEERLAIVFRKCSIPREIENIIRKYLYLR